MSPDTKYNEESDLMEEVELAPKVILFNDEIHSFDEVINQIIIATGYTYEKAQQITYEVHNNGKAITYSGDMFNCVKVSAILEEIELLTQIEC